MGDERNVAPDAVKEIVESRPGRNWLQGLGLLFGFVVLLDLANSLLFGWTTLSDPG